MKEINKLPYTINKYLLALLFLIYYRPKFVNTNYIPKDGPIIVCGNHIHLFDQCLPIISTKRMLHYLAKSEYFDGKMAWFFKASGCISVNRKVHDETAKNAAIDLLKKGYGIGIFPEGTRNSITCKKEKFEQIYNYVSEDISYTNFYKKLKKNMTRVSQCDFIVDLYRNNRISLEKLKNGLYDVDSHLKEYLKEGIISEKEYLDSLLLPLKYGTVSMAQKTNATIVPYAITGKYKFWKNNLTITFLPPITVSLSDDLTVKNDLLAEEIKQKIKDANFD